MPDATPIEVSPDGITTGTDLPPVDHAAVTASNVPPPPPAPGAAAPPVDFKGRTFDPTLHDVDAAGKPVFCKDPHKPGKFLHLLRCKRGMPPRRGASRVADPAEPITREEVAAAYPHVAPPPPPAGQSTVNFEVPAAAAAAPAAPGLAAIDNEAMMLASAQTCAGVQLMAMRAALGEKLGDKENQRDELVRAWMAIWRHYGMGPMHPIMGLAMVSGGIVVAALEHEETVSKLTKVRNWFQHRALSLWQWMTGRRRKASPIPPSPSVVEPESAKAA